MEVMESLTVMLNSGAKSKSLALECPHAVMYGEKNAFLTAHRSQLRLADHTCELVPQVHSQVIHTESYWWHVRKQLMVKLKRKFGFGVT